MSLFRGEGDGSIPRREIFSYQYLTAPVAGGYWCFVADRAYNLVAVREIHSVVGTSITFRVRKIQVDGQAPSAAAAANVIEMTPAISGATTVNTTQNVAPSITQISAGDRIAVNIAGTVTGYIGELQLEVEAA